MNKPLLSAANAAARYGVLALLGVTALMAQTPATAPTATTTSSSAPTDPQKLEKFEVTGSRIKRIEVEGPSPITIISRADIETSGRTNLTELLRELPEASQIGINEGGTTAAVRGSTALDLRNLGPNNTLVIVNGRRVVLTGSNSGGTTFVDLNRFPLAMIERIEVLKDGASAIYGADATAGVVNIITRRDYNGFEVTTSYGNTFKSDAAEKTVSFFGGAASGKASATIAFSYFERNALDAKDRSFSNNADLSARFLARGAEYAPGVAAGSYDLRSGTGNQARVSRLGGGFLPGTQGKGAVTAANPTGSLTSATPSFTAPSTTGTGGVFNQAVVSTYEAQRLTPGGNPSNLYNFQPFVRLVPEAQRLGFAGSFKYDITTSTRAYLDLAYQHNESETQLAPSPISTAGDNGIFVPATNFYNPFGVDVSFNYRPTEVGPRIANITSNTMSLLIGVQGRFLDAFDWDVGYTYGRDETVDATTNAMSESRTRAALARTDATALNIFGGPGYRNNVATINGIKVNSQRGGSAELNLFDAKVSGTIFRLPMGEVGAALYTEYREEYFNEANDAISTTLDDIIGQVRLAGATSAYRNVKSYAAEVNVPLISAGSMRFVQDLSLTVAARFEDFSDGYDSGIKPYYGLRYQPFKSLLLRASYTEAFRAPTLPQLFGGVRESLPNGLPDFARPQGLTGDPFDGPSTQRLVRAGGNPNLLPEEAEAFQLGFVYDIPLKPLEGLSFEATFGQIEQTNLITTVGTAFIRGNEFGDAAGLIVRQPGTETYTNNTAAPITVYTGPGARLSPGADRVVAPGQSVTVPGRILSISDSSVNVAFQRIRYFDFGLRYNKRTTNYGRFSFSSNATYTQQYTFTRTPNVSLPNFVDRDGYPRYRIATRAEWSYKGYGAGVSNNYTPGYGDFNLDGYYVDHHSTYNGYISYQMTAGRFIGPVKITIGMDNILDQDPPLYYDGTGYDQSLVGRPQGRFGYIALKREF